MSPEVTMGLKDMGFKTPTPIQRDAIPVILDGKDILASAQTGTGKTAAFAIPIIEKLFKEKKTGIRVLILAPTRELAQQIDEQFWTIGYHTGTTSVCVYGGGDWGTQQQAVKNGVDVIVATPGRLIDLIKFMNLDFSNLECLVLDEADRMLDMGFLPDVKSIIYRLPKKRQSLLFSATISDRVEALASDITRNPVRINVSSFKTAEGVTQIAYKVSERDKFNLVLHLYNEMKWQSSIIFMSTKRGASELARALKKQSVAVGSMHGDMDQSEREATLAEFRNNKITTIVATDVMARGIDIINVSHVINFSVPRDLDDYIHRIGRTARAEKKGTAITFVTREEDRYFKPIISHIGNKLTVLDSPVSGPEDTQTPLLQRPARSNSRRSNESGKRDFGGQKSHRKPADRRPSQYTDNAKTVKPEAVHEDNKSVHGDRKAPRQTKEFQQNLKPNQQDRYRGNPEVKKNSENGSVNKQDQLIRNVMSPTKTLKEQNVESTKTGIWSAIKRIIRKTDLP